MSARIYQHEITGARGGLVRDVIERLFRRKRVVLALLIAWTGAVVGYICLQPLTYEHEIRFLVRNNRIGMPVTPESNNGPVYRDYVDEAAIATEIQLLSSHNLQRAVVEKSQLAKDGSNEAIEKAVKDLGKDLKIGPVLKANMIKARYSGTDPNQVKSVLSNLAEGFLNEHLRAHSSSGAYDLFDKQAGYYEQRLKDLQGQLTQFQSKRNIVLLGEQKDLNVKRYLELEAALKATQTARVENIRKMARLKDQLGSLGPRVITQSRQIPNQYSIERLNTMLVELNNRQTQLLTKFQPDDRQVVEVRKQIADTQAALARADTAISTEQTSDVNPVRQTVEGEVVKAEIAEAEYKARAAGLEKQMAESGSALKDLRGYTPENDRLSREIKEAEDNFFLYSKKREDARIENVMDRERIANVILVEPPQAPSLPAPRVSATLVATYILGCLLIAGFALVLSMTHQTVYTAWELEGMTGIPVVAEVPMRRIGLDTRLIPQPTLLELEP